MPVLKGILTTYLLASEPSRATLADILGSNKSNIGISPDLLQRKLSNPRKLGVMAMGMWEKGRTKDRFEGVFRVLVEVGRGGRSGITRCGMLDMVLTHLFQDPIGVELDHRTCAIIRHKFPLG